MEWLIMIAIKVIGLFLSGEAKVEFKRTGKVLEPNSDRSSRAIEFLRMHYQNKGSDSPSVDASNFKRDDS
jgi:hypothetical protein